MAKSLCCRLGYHRFGPWEEGTKAVFTAASCFSPRRYSHRIRRCKRCGLVQDEYSPQVGMLVSPPE